MEALRNDAVVNDMLKNLEDDDYKTVISFIEYLTDSRKKKRTEGDKNEGDMLADMAEFKRLCDIYHHWCWPVEEK